ncbi:MAG: patatin-like phospholipase family protein [candidate division KSB1 bacterium]|nr:patatin-like phospholipase family protein [candidate division KSB1 bacterium]
MHYVRLIIFLFFVFVAYTCVEAEQVIQQFKADEFQVTNDSALKADSTGSPTIGLALSGGGIRGVAQIGVLDVFDEYNIKVDMIVGTSIGAAVGALYCSGYTPKEIMQLVHSVDWSRVFQDKPERSSLFLGEKNEKDRALLSIPMKHFKPIVPEAFSAGQQITKILTDFLLNAPYHEYDFRKLKPPLAILATDMLNGREVLIQEGDLVQTVRSSIAIPLLFSPVKRDSTILIDGGISCNIPVVQTRKSGADIVIAVNSTSPLRPRDKINAPWEIADQVTTIMQKSLNKEQLKKADHVIDFSDLEFISTQYNALDSLYLIGRKRALKMIDSLLHAGPKLEFSKVETNGIKSIPALQSPLAVDSLYSVLSALNKENNAQKIDAQLLICKQDTVLNFKIRESTLLSRVIFLDNHVISDSVLLEPFQPLLRQPVYSEQLDKALDDVLRIYRMQGYSLARIDSVELNPQTGFAEITVSEGRIGDIRYIGNLTTRNYILSREFLLNSGDIFQKPRAEAGIDNIYATNLFHSVLLGWKQNQDLYDLKIYTHESQPQNLRLGLRYGSERYTKAFVEFSDENVGGLGNDAVFHLQYGMIDFNTSFQFRADRIFKTYLTAQLDMHYDRSEHKSYRMLKQVGKYQRESAGIVLQMGQQIARFGTISGYLRFEEIDLDSLRGSGYDRGNMTINTIGFKTTIDTRDQLPFPRSGTYHIFSYEASSGFMLGADKSYNKVENQLSGYRTFFKRHTFNPLLHWGISDRTTPYSEQFRIGGYDSFYGLHQGQMWGRYLFKASMGYRCRFLKLAMFPFYVSLRYDLGGSWDELEEITSQDFIFGYGASVDIETPVGPFSLAYGRTNKQQETFYLNLGFHF